jgi:hypothetical protein
VNDIWGRLRNVDDRDPRWDLVIDEAANNGERLRDRLKWFEEAGGVAMATRIFQVSADLSKWKARAQVMREWMLDRELGGADAAIAWWAFVEERPEAGDWFDDDGVPK